MRITNLPNNHALLRFKPGFWTQVGVFVFFGKIPSDQCPRCSSFEAAVLRIQQKAPTYDQTQQHAQIWSTMSNQQKRGVDALEMFAKAKDKD